MAAQAQGIFAESQVCAALEREGWVVLMRRARTPCGEIDIVAELPARTLIAFVEVKTRPSLADAAAAVSRAQRTRLLGAAGILLARNPDWSARSLRFDLVLVDGAGRMRRIADAFRVGDA